MAKVNMSRIPVYPEFARMSKSIGSLGDNIHLCEDDRGRIAFISQKDKDECLKERRRYQIPKRR